ncbi:MAG: methionine synthase [Acidimicrobiales bacterium]|nr:MAG: methionine synthase [Acidimicrobiales bacterium]
MTSTSTYLAAVAERVVIFDGATGTNLQRLGLGPDDFGGPQYEGCNEHLVLTRPDVIADLHASFFEVGVDVVETDTFGAFAVPLREYGLEDKAYEINRRAAEIARAVADKYSTESQPRWVAGSIGPGTKLPSLGQIRFAELLNHYEVQARGLLEGGVDLIIIETQYDLLGAKAAMIASRRAMQAAGRQVPLQVQVTIEQNGRMLPGTEIGAALAALDAMRPDVIGLNCATGPAEMFEHVRYLSEHARMPISVIPNAGLPQVVDGEMHYDLTPSELASHLAEFITELGVRVVGGCCGTTPEHLAEVVRRCRGLSPAPRDPVHEPGAASIYSFTPFRQETSFLIIGERANANGSKRFREAMLAEDWETCVRIAREQVTEGAHLVDVCVDYTGRDGVGDMDQIASRLAAQSPVPLVLDSTEPEVMEAGLQWIGGRAVLNSANLEDGDAPGSRCDRVFSLAREYGAAVICLLIDEEGQARDLDWKMRIAHRLYRIATERYGLEPGDLIFDALTFPLGTGGEEYRRDAIATIEAIRRIKAELPGVFTTLGVSNVSFGLSPAIRPVLNSVFLHECLEAGLDSAIVHAGRIVPLSRIPEEQRRVCLDLIYDRRTDSYDPLLTLMNMFSDVEVESRPKEDRSSWPVGRRLARRIVDGDREGLEADLDEALETMTPLEIINEHLLEGMKEVGELFASGEMQLPFVLQSAETMKAAVAYLEPHMEKVEGSRRGKLVLATVKGDVHDIGKNLVDIILSNNGYEVHNLGIKVPIADMIAKAEEVGADAIGMSGLLVKSTLIMRENLEELNRRGLSHIPVLLGGAALTRTYVERDLRKVYEGRVFYGRDAFEGLRVMDRLMRIKKGEEPDDPSWGREPVESTVRSRIATRGRQADVELPRRSPEVATDNPIPRPPFLGSRTVKGLPIDEIAAYLNETALFRNQWQFRPNKGESDEDFKARIRPVLAEQLAVAKERGILVPQVVYGYFPVNADGDDLVVFEEDDRVNERVRFHFPRQKEHPWLCIADFFRPIESGEADYAAFHIVTMGPQVSRVTAELFQSGRYREYLFMHGLGVEMAEALAEYWHKRIREEWGIADEDGPTLQALFRQQYRGGRYSWGYPACPDLEDNFLVWKLLEAERIGVVVGEDTAWQFQPEQTTSAIICHHPQAKYFVAR